MAHTPLQKFTSVNRTEFHTDGSNVALSNVLQSEPVKRLFNQPNIIIKTISLNSNTNTASSDSIITIKRNGFNNSIYVSEKPEISIHAIKNLTTDGNNKGGDEKFLPSKNDGKSEISIQPVFYKKKPCGHCGPCESLICDVLFQNYVDESGVSPMLATSIEEHEITAPVTKHCKNDRCDALSIDHNRCRRAMVKLYKCDKHNCCDICGIAIKSRKLRVNHKNCKRKDVYQHNETAVSEIMKRKMRERELQLMEAAKFKTYDYLDPVNGHNRALELLKKNEELIVIPKTSTITHQTPIVTITTIPTTTNQQLPTSNKSQPEPAPIRNIYSNVVSNIPIVFPQQSLIVNTTPQTKPTVTNQTKPTISTSVVTTPFVTVSTVPQSPQNNNIRPLILSNWVNNQSQVITTPIQPKPFLTPIRVVPIANFKSQPSLLHQVQGMPKFCIMADTTNVQTQSVWHPPPLVRLQPIQPNKTQPILPNVNSTVKSDSSPDSISKKKKKKKGKMYNRKALMRSRRKILRERMGKTFACPFCSKKLGTEWYFKMHVARHKGETPYVCKVCEKSFVNAYEMKKHFTNKHTESEIRCELCDHVAPAESDLLVHMKTEQENLKCSDCGELCKNCEALNKHQKTMHGSVPCRLCFTEVPFVRFVKHVILRHGMTKNRAKNEFEKFDITANIIIQRSNQLEEKQILPDQECNGLDEFEGTIKIEPLEYEEEIPEDEEEEENEEEREGENNINRIGVNYYESNGNSAIKEEMILADDGPLCNFCGNVFESEQKYKEHGEHCVGSISDDEANGEDM